ncbi:Uncharacterised protein [Starkeya nomas]|uniref:Glycine zipper domain-containing protein n=2 Tax=Xanthobacteraceae TaxID=335928 RepID=A0A5S9NFN1_9HYPH|nr:MULTISPECIES: hypothetical protein [Xanthobacteraceae]TSJ62037.1 hypothetical protein FO470_10700 [Ancylobacter moscoviensis]CAA0089082.1 Uncharacterised protein [Starkeya nomas]
MSHRWTFAALLAAGLALCFAAPASARNDTARGALIGGATGAVIGGAVTGSGGGAAAGALIGAGTGAAVGANRSRRARSSYFWRNGRCYVQQRNGRIVRVDRRHCR